MRGRLGACLLIVFFLVGFVSAFSFGDFFGKITGNAVDNQEGLDSVSSCVSRGEASVETKCEKGTQTVTKINEKGDITTDVYRCKFGCKDSVDCAESASESEKLICAKDSIGAYLSGGGEEKEYCLYLDEDREITRDNVYDKIKDLTGKEGVSAQEVQGKWLKEYSCNGDRTDCVRTRECLGKEDLGKQCAEGKVCDWDGQEGNCVNECKYCDLTGTCSTSLEEIGDKKVAGIMNGLEFIPNECVESLQSTSDNKEYQSIISQARCKIENGVSVKKTYGLVQPCASWFFGNEMENGELKRKKYLNQFSCIQEDKTINGKSYNLGQCQTSSCASKQDGESCGDKSYCCGGSCLNSPNICKEDGDCSGKCIEDSNYPLSDFSTNPGNICYAKCDSSCKDGGPNKDCIDDAYSFSIPPRCRGSDNAREWAVCVEGRCSYQGEGIGIKNFEVNSPLCECDLNDPDHADCQTRNAGYCCEERGCTLNACTPGKEGECKEGKVCAENTDYPGNPCYATCVDPCESGSPVKSCVDYLGEHSPFCMMDGVGNSGEILPIIYEKGAPLRVWTDCNEEQMCTWNGLSYTKIQDIISKFVGEEIPPNQISSFPFEAFIKDSSLCSCTNVGQEDESCKSQGSKYCCSSSGKGELNSCNQPPSACSNNQECIDYLGEGHICFNYLKNDPSVDPCGSECRKECKIDEKGRCMDYTRNLLTPVPECGQDKTFIYWGCNAETNKCERVVEKEVEECDYECKSGSPTEACYDYKMLNGQINEPYCKDGLRWWYECGKSQFSEGECVLQPSEKMPELCPEENEQASKCNYMEDTLNGQAICCMGIRADNPCQYTSCVYTETFEEVGMNVYLDEGAETSSYCSDYQCTEGGCKCILV